MDIIIQNLHVTLTGAQQEAAALIERAMTDTAAPAGESSLPALAGLPKIKAPWPGVDGVFIGVSTAPDGVVYALVLLNAKSPNRLEWAKACEWAKQQGGELPNRVDGALCFANARDCFEAEWHWTSEQYSDAYAWGQYFGNGTQGTGNKSYEGWARAVRRFPL
jgi:hypothetical protein